MGHSKEPAHTPESRAAIETGNYRLDLAELEYRTWRKVAAQVLRNRDDLAWGILHENAWMRLYVEGLSPEEAADWARTRHNSLSFSERLRPR
jgi:hypothetical protein